ncbi:MAG: hypothetical protein H0W49_03825 [Nitrospirales bacterium]|nr:hypothetical protein [Nitrospirales bacterium]MBA3964423.1 hypothetical protein [Nitrospirales bacterium]
MKQNARNFPLALMRFLWIAPLLLSGVVACQEEHEPVITPPAQSNNLPGVVPIQPPTESNLPTVSQEEAPTTGTPRNITGEVISIEGKTYVIKDQEEKEIQVEANSMTLVDESIGVGDKAEIRYSADNQPIAIRKMRKVL